MGLRAHRDSLRSALPRPLYLAGAAVHRQLPKSRLDRRGLQERMALSTLIHDRCDGTVQRGPFAGLRLPAITPDSASKLVGAYESELYPTLTQLLDQSPATVIDVGCAEGFYAVGPALALPTAAIAAFDIEPSAQAACAVTVAANGVGDRVTTGGGCTPERLAEIASDGALIIVDIEGAELELLSQPASLTKASLIVELHDFVRPGLTDELVARFTPTHHVELITSTTRDPHQFPELADLSPTDATLALFERPITMQWAVITP